MKSFKVALCKCWHSLNRRGFLLNSFRNCLLETRQFLSFIYLSIVLSPCPHSFTPFIHSLFLLFIHYSFYSSILSLIHVSLLQETARKKLINVPIIHHSFTTDTSIATRNNYISPNHLFIHSPHFHPSLQEIALIYHSPGRQLLIHSLTHISISAWNSSSCVSHQPITHMLDPSNKHLVHPSSSLPPTNHSNNNNE